MQAQSIALTLEEQAEIAPLIARLEGQAAGYMEGIEASKRLIVKKFLDNRKGVPNDAIPQPEHAATGHAPADAKQPVSQGQSARAGESERASAGQYRAAPDAGSTGSDARHGVPEQRSATDADEQPIERACANGTFTGSTAAIPVVFPLSHAEPWIERAFDGVDGAADQHDDAVSGDAGAAS